MVIIEAFLVILEVVVPDVRVEGHRQSVLNEIENLPTVAVLVLEDVGALHNGVHHRLFLVELLGIRHQPRRIDRIDVQGIERFGRFLQLSIGDSPKVLKLNFQLVLLGNLAVGSVKFRRHLNDLGVRGLEVFNLRKGVHLVCVVLVVQEIRYDDFL